MLNFYMDHPPTPESLDPLLEKLSGIVEQCYRPGDKKLEQLAERAKRDLIELREALGRGVAPPRWVGTYQGVHLFEHRPAQDCVDSVGALDSLLQNARASCVPINAIVFSEGAFSRFRADVRRLSSSIRGAS